MKCIKQILNLTSIEKDVSFYYLKLLKLAAKVRRSSNIARSNNIAPTVANFEKKPKATRKRKHFQ
jgi:hypothetical protein